MTKNKTKKALASLAIVGIVMTMTPLNAFADTGVTAARSSSSDKVGSAVTVGNADCKQTNHPVGNGTVKDYHSLVANHSDGNFPALKETYKDSNDSNEYIIAGPNDSLYDIAIQYDTTVSNLMYLNPQISNPYQVYPGERIIVSNDNQWGNGLLNQQYSNGNQRGDKSPNQQNASKGSSQDKCTTKQN